MPAVHLLVPPAPARTVRRREDRIGRVLLGVGLGALAGGVAGRLIAGDGCRRPGCDSGGPGIWAYTLGGAVLGGAAGGLVGGLWGGDADAALGGAPGRGAAGRRAP